MAALDCLVEKRVYFAGEKIRSRLYLSFEETETIEWCTVQVHGHVACDPRLVSQDAILRVTGSPNYDHDERMRRLKALETNVQLHKMNEASLRINDESIFVVADSDHQLKLPKHHTSSMPDVTLLSGKFGHCIFASPAEVIACMKTGTANSELSFAFECSLPPVLPPSYIGTAARYFYLITFGVKFASRANAEIVHVQFNVLPVSVDEPTNVPEPGDLKRTPSVVLLEHQFCVNSWFLGESFVIGGEASGSNRSFTDLQVCDDYPVNPSSSSFTMKNIDTTGAFEETSVNSEQIFSIGSSGFRIANLHLFKQVVRPGDEILLMFDFSEGSVLQVTAALEIEEVSKCPLALSLALEPLSKNTATELTMGPWSRIVASKTCQVAFNRARSITLSVPPDITPDFETSLISVKGYLRFEFVTCIDPQYPIKTNENLHVCPWRIPIDIIPPETPSDTPSGILFLSSSSQSNLLHKRTWL